jgi:DNA-binding NtrC family response regulator
MSARRQGEEKLAPIFLIADDRGDAGERLTEILPSDWFYVPVRNPALVERYSLQFAPTGIFLAEDIEFPKGGAARLLQILLDRVGAPVVILAEECTPEGRARWKRMGAKDCVAHPIRQDRRREGIVEVLRELALGPLRHSIPGLPKSGDSR